MYQMMSSFIAFGIAIGFPWNALISSNSYYEHKLNESSSLAELESALSFSYFGMNLLGYAYLHVFSNAGASEHMNEHFITMFFYINVSTFALMAVSPVMSINLFWLVVTVGAILGLTSALYQHEMFALSAKQGPQATFDFLFGFAFAGFLASLCGLATRSLAGAELTATLNFGMTLVSLFVGAGLYFAHAQKQSTAVIVDTTMDEVDHEELLEEEEEIQGVALPDIRWFLAVLALVMSGTLMVFPGVVSAIKPTSSTRDPQEFTSILFCLFNFGDLFGRAIAERTLRWASPQSLTALSIARFALLFLCFICNQQEDGKQQNNVDGWVYVLILVIGISGGQLFSAAAAAAPSAMPQDPARAGKLVALSIAVSLAFGAVLGVIVVGVM